MRPIVEAHINQALSSAAASGELSLAGSPESAVERPRDPSHGDWACTIALKLAKELGKNPREIARIIVKHLAKDATFAKVEIAGPGFINLTLSDSALAAMLREAFEQNTAYASTNLGAGRTINVEFISANPTGPMHVGHGRWAALGNALCNVLEHTGWKVCKEFYINDAGNQMDKFGESLAARYLQELGEQAPVPEDGYHGTYLIDIAKELVNELGTSYLEVADDTRNAAMRELGYQRMLKSQQDVCLALGLTFDVWFSERELYETKEQGDGSADGISEVEVMLKKLEQGGYLFEKEGATWFRSTSFTDDKDRVLIKSDGTYTYFAPDIAYHLDKFERPVNERYPKGGSEYLINIWGADHHGYVPRMQAAVAALGHEGRLSVILGQLVNLFRDGQPVRMSKRTGEMVTFEELVEEVGADATKYLMLSRSADQPIDFDIELAKKQDASNPVYYVQYAHARICSVLRKAREAGLDVEDLMGEVAALEGVPSGDGDLLLLLQADAEKDLIRYIGQLGELVEQCARDLTPFKLAYYAEGLASRFHKFYTDCVIIGEDTSLSRARLYLSETTRRVLALVLGLLGVSAPERM
ncbi:MAG: arginine--tRNA ligase [Coriobacteriales bacterium]|jgi:arginyl-tRNA synthetase|nr:arginine--tRNA ligase [Coriobacteriales bacterium]